MFRTCERCILCISFGVVSVAMNITDFSSFGLAKAQDATDTSNHMGFWYQHILHYLLWSCGAVSSIVCTQTALRLALQLHNGHWLILFRRSALACFRIVSGNNSEYVISKGLLLPVLWLETFDLSWDLQRQCNGCMELYLRMTKQLRIYMLNEIYILWLLPIAGITLTTLKKRCYDVAQWPHITRSQSGASRSPAFICKHIKHNFYSLLWKLHMSAWIATAHLGMKIDLQGNRSWEVQETNITRSQSGASVSSVWRQLWICSWKAMRQRRFENHSAQ